MEGDFSVLMGTPDEFFIKYLKDAYDAITKLNLWNDLSQYTPEQNKGFMFSSSPLLSQITSEMKLMDDHSGSSYGLTMRVMEFISKNGWDSYVKSLKN
jgi:hypothetical protein